MEGFNEYVRCLSLGVAVLEVNAGLHETLTQPLEVDPLGEGQVPHGWSVSGNHDLNHLIKEQFVDFARAKIYIKIVNNYKNDSTKLRK